MHCAGGVGISGQQGGQGLDPGRLRPGVRGQGLWPCALGADNTAPCCPAWAAGDLTPPDGACVLASSRLFEGDGEAGLCFLYWFPRQGWACRTTLTLAVPVIPVNETANQGAGGGPTARGGGLLARREDGGQALACQPVGSGIKESCPAPSKAQGCCFFRRLALGFQPWLLSVCEVLLSPVCLQSPSPLGSVSLPCKAYSRSPCSLSVTAGK